MRVSVKLGMEEDVPVIAAGCLSSCLISIDISRIRGMLGPMTITRSEVPSMRISFSAVLFVMEVGASAKVKLAADMSARLDCF